MITSANLTLTELKQMWLELFLNKTDKVSDVADDSVLNATAYGCSKVAQKAIKDIAIVEAKLFPKYAKGSYLDESAKLFGAEERRGAIGSSTYLLVKATPGTEYIKTTNIFKNLNGISFEMEEDSVIVGDSGFEYIKVRSTGTGIKTNVNANTVSIVVPVPIGHIGITNEYMATGGADEESDDVFRNRILTSKSYLSKTTKQYYIQILQSIDDRILSVYIGDRDENGNSVFKLSTQNGSSFTENELDIILDLFKSYLPSTELNQFGNTTGLTLSNVDYHEIGSTTGIDFRCVIDPSYNTDDVRKNIQINISKIYDFRTWVDGTNIEWDDILSVVKNTEGVRYVYDEYFYPNQDERVSWGKLPRVKRFVMRDVNGVIVYDNNGILSPIFYPSE
jgi:hypothetical protein